MTTYTINLVLFLQNYNCILGVLDALNSSHIIAIGHRDSANGLYCIR